MSRKKVIISACLLGEFCRYDGKTKKINTVIEAFSDYEIIPFCPEAPLFGTPREKISVIKIGSDERIIKDISGEDVTALLTSEIESFINKYNDVDAIVLKSKSPSCGYNSTPIYSAQKEQLTFGSGIAAKLLHQHFQEIVIVDERSFETREL